MFITNALFTLSSRVFVFLLGTGTVLITARILGPAGRGEVSLILLGITFLAILGDLGVGLANTYFIATARAPIAPAVQNSVFVALALGLPLGLVWFAAAGAFSELFTRSLDVFSLALSCVLLPTTMLLSYLLAILLGSQRILAFGATSAAQAGSTFVLSCVLVGICALGVSGAILAAVGGSLVGVIIAAILLGSRTALVPKLRVDLLREAISFGFPGQIGNAVQFFNYRLDVFLVGYFLGVAGVGWYSIAVSLGESLWHIPSALATVLFPKTAASDPAARKPFTASVCRHTLALSLSGAVLLGLLGNSLVVTLFTEAFAPSVPALWLLLPGVVALSLNKVVCSDLIGQGMPQYATYSAFLSLGLTVALDLILIPTHGITGAAIASSLSYSAATIFVLVCYLNISGNRLSDVVILRRADLRLYFDIGDRAASATFARLVK